MRFLLLAGVALCLSSSSLAAAHPKPRALDAALIEAAGSGQAARVRSLLLSGADANARDREGTTPLLAVASRHNSEDEKQQDAATTAVARVLLDHGARVEGERYEDGDTILIRAVENQNEGVVRLLLQHGARVDAPNTHGETALMHASRPMARLLLAHHANPNARDEEGQTPLMRAGSDTVEFLLAAGAQINACDNNGETALMKPTDPPEASASSWDMDVVRALLRHGADVNARNKSGQSVLLRAAQTGFEEMVALLLKRGACVNLPDLSGRTPLMQASEGFDTHIGWVYAAPGIVRLLLAHGADVNARTSAGNSALILAARWKAEDGMQKSDSANALRTIKLLLAHGADVNARTKNGNTPLKWARLNGRRDAVRLLQHVGARG